MRPVFLCSRSNCLSCFLSVWSSGVKFQSFGFQGGQFVEGGRQCVVVDVDEVHGGWIYRKGEARECLICRLIERIDRWI